MTSENCDTPEDFSIIIPMGATLRGTVNYSKIVTGVFQAADLRFEPAVALTGSKETLYGIELYSTDIDLFYNYG